MNMQIDIGMIEWADKQNDFGNSNASKFFLLEYLQDYFLFKIVIITSM